MALQPFETGRTDIAAYRGSVCNQRDPSEFSGSEETCTEKNLRP